jgi:hypothetical protein
LICHCRALARNVLHVRGMFAIVIFSCRLAIAMQRRVIKAISDHQSRRATVFGGVEAAAGRVRQVG